jgi:hypothetical protein
MSTAAERHIAAHEIDDACQKVVRLLHGAIEPAYLIGAGAHLAPIIESVKTLHAAATIEHEKSVREMSN